MVSWFSGESEIGPELTLLASRGKRQADGSLVWTKPAEFLKASDRNMHSSNLLNNSVRISSKRDSEFTLHQLASIGVAGRWDKLALGYRSSTDNLGITEFNKYRTFCMLGVVTGNANITHFFRGSATWSHEVSFCFVF